MGRNLNAVNDVLRGEYDVTNKFLIWYNADVLFQKEFDTFKKIVNIMLTRSEEDKKRGLLFRVILLFDEEKVTSLKKILKDKEKYPIELRRIITSNKPTFWLFFG